MLLVIHNLPANIRYSDIKDLIKEKCGSFELILDNLVSEGRGKKVTVGLADEEDAALLVRKINGLYIAGQQLYVEDVRKKKESEQPYWNTSMLNEGSSFQPNNYQAPSNNFQGPGQMKNPNFSHKVPTMVPPPMELNNMMCVTYPHIQNPYVKNFDNQPQQHSPVIQIPDASQQQNFEYGSMRNTGSAQESMAREGGGVRRDRTRSPFRTNQPQPFSDYDNEYSRVKPTYTNQANWDKARRSRSPPHHRRQHDFDDSYTQRYNKNSSQENSVFGDDRSNVKPMMSYDQFDQSNRNIYGEHVTKPRPEPAALSRKRQREPQLETNSFKTTQSSSGPAWPIKNRAEGRKEERADNFEPQAKKFAPPKLQLNYTPKKKNVNTNIPKQNDASMYVPKQDPPKEQNPKPKSIEVLLNKDATWRGQAVSSIAKQMMTSLDLVEKRGVFLKQLKSALRTRIDVILGSRVAVPEPEIIKMYRRKFPPFTDRSFLDVIMKKVLEQANDNKDKAENKIEAAKQTTTVSGNATTTKAVKAPKPTNGGNANQKLTDKTQKEKMDIEQNALKKLDPKLQKALVEELDIIGDMFNEECEDPTSDCDKTVGKLINTRAIPAFKTYVKIKTAQRLSNVRTNLFVKIFYTPKSPNINALDTFLKSFGVTSLEQSGNRRLFIAKCNTYENYDRLCQLQNTTIGKMQITIMPVHEAGPPNIVKKSEIQKLRQDMIARQIVGEQSQEIKDESHEISDYKDKKVKCETEDVTEEHVDCILVNNTGNEDARDENKTVVKDEVHDEVEGNVDNENGGVENVDNENRVVENVDDENGVIENVDDENGGVEKVDDENNAGVDVDESNTDIDDVVKGILGEANINIDDFPKDIYDDNDFPTTDDVADEDLEDY